MAASLFYISIIVIGCLSVVVAAERECGESQKNASNGTYIPPVLNGTSVCTTIADAKAFSLIHGSCTRFLQNRCSLYHKNDTQQQRSVVDSVTRAINSFLGQRSDTGDARWCSDVLLGIVCNSMYLGCDPATDRPIGLCARTCLEYSTASNCSQFFAEVTEAMNKTGEDIDLNVYTNCTAGHSLLEGVNGSDECYQAITGIETLPQSTTEVVTTAPSSVPTTENGSTGGAEGMRNVALAYVLPSISAVLGTAIVVVLVMSGCYLRRLRKRSRCVGISVGGDSHSHTNAFPQLLWVREIYSNRYTVPNVINEDGNRDIERSVLPVTTSTTTTSSGASNVTENSAVFQLDLADWAAVGDGVLIPFESLTITGHLGEGAFGYVVKGLLKEVHENGLEYHMPVAMKTLKNCATYAEMRGLLVESSLMHSFCHPHILSLRGLCLNPKSGAPYLVMPFMENGDLRKFLRKKADLTDGSASITTFPHGLTHDLLAQMCCDVAKGMEYLAEKRLVHRDLAARNCMVDRSLRVKVADFGLTREIYEQDCYRQSSHGQLPIKWMSPESLAYRMSNEKTDVWSFGVTCWEVFSLGKVPYPSIDNRDLLDYLDCGRRLSKPRLCNQHVYDIMQLCWKMQPDERPTFSDIVALLEATPTHESSEQTRPTRTSCTNSTPQPTSHSVMKRSVTVPVTRAEMDTNTGANTADEEYVEMTCKGKSDEEVLIVVNRSTGTNGAEMSNPKYFNVTDTSGVAMERSLPPIPHSLHHISETADQESLIMSNPSATITPSPNENKTEEMENSTCAKGSSGVVPVSSVEKAPMEAVTTETVTMEKGSIEGGLLDSIINYFQEKTTGSEEPAERDTDTDFLAVQIKEIETTYRSASVSSPSSMTSSLPHSHAHSSRRRSTTQRGSKFTPSGKSVVEVPSHPYQRISIYDECPTTPNVTISFATGERVTPAEKLSEFSRNRSKTAGSIGGLAKDTGQSRESHSGETRTDIAGRKREGEGRSSVVSMPGGRQETGGGRWRERMRERFYSYSAGDYVKMHPAPHRQ